MPHIALPDGLPGIMGPFAFRPETAKPLCELADVLLRGESPLTRADRELIAAFVSSRNGCRFCAASHGAAAAHQPGGSAALVEAVQRDAESAPISPKMKALVALAGAVQESGRRVTTETITRARAAGASDLEIHDTVLIAAAFSMYNRYVDGLDAMTPVDSRAYDWLGRYLASQGYNNRGMHLFGRIWSWVARRIR